MEIALHEKGLAFDRTLAPFTQTAGYSPKLPAVLAANPKGQVPVLVDGDVTVWDSTVILEYLEDAYPTPPLYPETPGERARCRLLDAFADEVMIVPLRDLMHRTAPRPADPGRWAAAEAKAEQATRALDGHFAELDRRLAASQPFLCGALSVADISVFMAVLYALRLGGPDIGSHAHLRAWYLGLKARSAFARVTAEIAEADRKLSAPVEGAYRGAA